MKITINKKKYNNRTAKSICGYVGRVGKSFGYVSYELFRKKDGEFFLYVEGGDLDDYDLCYEDRHIYGEDIHVISDEKAKEFVFRCNFPELIEKLF